MPHAEGVLERARQAVVVVAPAVDAGLHGAAEQREQGVAGLLRWVAALVPGDRDHVVRRVPGRRRLDLRQLACEEGIELPHRIAVAARAWVVPVVAVVRHYERE